MDCTPLLTALLLRAAKDARGQGDHATEARQWLEQDGAALAACLGIDIRRWLRALRPSMSSHPTMETPSSNRVTDLPGQRFISAGHWAPNRAIIADRRPYG